MKRAVIVLLAWLASGAMVSAQTVLGSRFQLTTGPCTIRSGSGAPSSGLGVVCDVYVRTDSPYTIYRKTGASTWAELYTAGATDVAVSDGGTGLSSWTTGQLVYASGSTTLAGLSAVASGQVLASNGTGAAPVYTASPSVTALTATGAVQGATVTGTTSVTTPTLTASANLTLSPAGDIITSPTGLDILPGTGYTTNIGALTNKYLSLHAAELMVETLVAQNTLATIGGRVLVGPTTTLTSDLASGSTSMAVKHNSLANGDRVLIEANGQVEWIAVASASSGSGPYTYTITRNLDGSGANNWTAGDAVFNTGTTNSGFIDLYSSAGVISGSGPTIVGNVRTGTTYNNIAARWAIGNLNGLYGYGATTYGTAFGDPSATNVTIDAANGVRFRSGTTDLLTLTSTTLDLKNTGKIVSGSATALASGTGLWLYANSGSPEFRVGSPSGDRLSWDGANLTMVSTNLTVNASGVNITPSTTKGSTRAYAFTVPTGEIGLFGNESSVTLPRRAELSTEWTGTGNLSNGTSVRLVAKHNPVSGGSGNAAGAAIEVAAVGGSTSIAATSPASTGTVSLAAGAGPDNVLTVLNNRVTLGTPGATDLTIFADNGSTSSNPYIRSDGNYLVIESRSTANGGNIFLGLDQNSIVSIGQGGGEAYIYKPFFVSTAPKWDVSLAQTTVGAAGAASALPATPAGYIKVQVNGVGTYVVPVYNP